MNLPLLFIFSILQGCLAIQKFSREPTYTEVNPGANAKLECSVQNIGGECRWQKDGKPIGIHHGKYQWSGQPSLGDCSLEVLEVNITFDDGLWECQVTSSNFQSQDALASKPARLVVREPPKTIGISVNGRIASNGANVTVTEGKIETLTCESRQSNPAPIIRWYLANLELTSTQTNQSEDGDSRRWMATSKLEYKFSKEHLKKHLHCRVFHPAYPTGEQERYVELNVQYKPVVRVSRNSDEVLEEGRSKAKLTCVADGNPAPAIFWRKYSRNASTRKQDRTPGDSLEFEPVMRKDSGTYICQAQNTVGMSNEEPIELDVLYPPKILRVTPASGSTVGVHNRTILTCSAEGNPLPKYQWLQKLPTQQVLKRGFEDKLLIEETNYDHQGDYVCEAINVIGGQRKIVQSEPVHIEVKGAPQVLRYSVAKEVEAISGRDVRLEMEVCSDPRPSRTTWDWGVLKLEAGEEVQGRFLSEQLVEHPEREDCYFARLHVRQVSPGDSRKYFLDVENRHGTDRYAVALTVKDPVSMASVIGVVIALLALFVLLVVVLLYAYKKQKMCFKDGSKLDKHIDSSDLEAEKAVNMRPSSRNGMNGMNGHGNGNGVSGIPLPPDGMYHVSDMSNGLENSHHGSLADKLWPENPAYQVYLPGYPHSLYHAQQQQPSLGHAPLRARSTTPTNENHHLHNRVLYNELQFPVTSNFGSMKKRSNRHSSSTNHTNSTTILSGDNSPNSTNDGSQSSTLPISQSLDNVNLNGGYVTEYLPSVHSRKTAV